MHNRNFWVLEVYPRPLHGGVDHEDALRHALDLLRSRQQHFERLREEVRPKDVSLHGGLYLRADEQCGIWLEPDQMRVLVDCQVGWGLDLAIADPQAT